MDAYFEILQSILTIMHGSGLAEAFFQLVLKRLSVMSYIPKAEDAWAIAFAGQKVENSIKNACNTSSVPAGLTHIAVDMVCGEFLYSKKQTGGLEDFNLAIAVKQVQAGDTNVTYAVGEHSPEEDLNLFISYLIHGGKDEFLCYRKLRW